jgi:flagellar basal body rod protein FlgG
MNIGLYQSAASLSALERWQDAVAQNITSSQVNGYRGRTVQFSGVNAGQNQLNPQARVGSEASQPAVFPTSAAGINFASGETQPTGNELDVAIQGEGFFEVQQPDGSRAYTRNGQFHLQPDRTVTTDNGSQLLTDGGTPLVLLPGGGSVTINHDGTVFQGDTSLGRLSVQNFSNPGALVPIAGSMFLPAGGAAPTPVGQPQLMQGYLEGSNVSPLHEMVNLVEISRAYEANQKMITSIDQEMQKTLDALG